MALEAPFNIKVIGKKLVLDELLGPYDGNLSGKVGFFTFLKVGHPNLGLPLELNGIYMRYLSFIRRGISHKTHAPHNVLHTIFFHSLFLIKDASVSSDRMQFYANMVVKYFGCARMIMQGQPTQLVLVQFYAWWRFLMRLRNIMHHICF